MENVISKFIDESKDGVYVVFNKLSVEEVVVKFLIEEYCSLNSIDFEEQYYDSSIDSPADMVLWLVGHKEAGKNVILLDKNLVNSISVKAITKDSRLLGAETYHEEIDNIEGFHAYDGRASLAFLFYIRLVAKTPMAEFVNPTIMGDVINDIYGEIPSLLSEQDFKEVKKLLFV